MKKIIIKVCNLRYSNPRNKLVACSCDWGQTFKYFNSNEYGGLIKAKAAANQWLKEQKDNKCRNSNVQ